MVCEYVQVTDFLQALSENLGAGAPAEDVKGLLQLVERWRAEPSDEDLASRILESLELLVERIETASFNDEGLPEQAASCLARLTAGFEQMRGALEELFESVESTDVSGVAQITSQVRETAQQIGGVEAELQQWMDNPGLCCPRCGSTNGEQGRCPGCGLELMVPNLTTSFESINVQLQDELYAVYNAYRDICNGNRTLSSLSSYLPPAREYLDGVLTASRKVSKSPENRAAGEGVSAAVEGVLETLDGLARALSTKRRVELDRAWNRTANACLELNQALPGLLEMLGVSDNAGEADQINLSRAD